jgi:hypothetical protein
MKIIKRRERIESTEHRRVFKRRWDPGSGASFPCAPDGTVNVAELPAAAQDNYARCIAESAGPTPTMRDLGMRPETHVYNAPAVGQCNHCRRHVTLSGFTNTCECGTDYNGAGQELASRSQWGEETGESVADILAADSDLWGGY